MPSNNLTTFKYATHAITGNRNHVNLLKIDLEKFMKSHQVKLFLVGFRHLKLMCAQAREFSALISLSSSFNAKKTVKIAKEKKNHLTLITQRNRAVS